MICSKLGRQSTGGRRALVCTQGSSLISGISTFKSELWPSCAWGKDWLIVAGTN